MKHYICIHGHFYQPPRENPWLEEVEVQDSAFPFHDWNERITTECYAPNSASRILDSKKNIIDIINNYAKISFNFGPTLLSWIEKNAPSVYQAVIDADKESLSRFSGHGSALSQAYSHMIMPLANSRDKRTQIVWGIKDFVHRFGRKPEGMWLPETAVDVETLNIMAECGIKFTVLAPHQAHQFRKIGEEDWTYANNGTIDTRSAYLCPLPSGRTIYLFFYDGTISNEIAFGDLLKDGERFAQRLQGAFSKEQNKPQIVHIATDGETFGHHHRFGEMALAYCLDRIETSHSIFLTVYGEHLEKYPPEYEVQIAENTSWSCVHGVERWRDHCGCSTGLHPGWKQKWRAPLREAMDWLRQRLESVYQDRMSALTEDPWKAREDYIDVVLDRSRENVDAFFRGHMSSALSLEKKVEALKLLEMQRNSMLGFTSCGWFFDDISGIEAVQVMQYAARAIQLARETGGKDYEPEYIKILERAPSNVSKFKNGAAVYKKLVQPAVLELIRVGVHYAVSALFEEYPETIKIGAYTSTSDIYDLTDSGREKLAVGKARLLSEITWEEENISFAVLHFGDHNLIGGARKFTDDHSFSSLHEEIKEAFTNSDIPEVIRLMDKHFGTHNYSLWHLFKDEKRKVLNQVLDSTLEEMETSFRQIYENQYSVMQALRENRVPLPKAFSTTVEFILNTDFRRLMEDEEFDLERLKKLVEEFKKWNLQPDRTLLSFVTSKKFDRLMEEVSKKPQDLSLWKTVGDLLEILRDFPLDLDLWRSQNIYFKVCQQLGSEMEKRSLEGDEGAKKWVDCLRKMGEYLRVKCL
jgi:alpha-amylase/alpha-mannosidase (GH57 family)